MEEETDILRTGLNDKQVEDSRRRYGENILTPPPTVPLWKKFLGKFSDPLIIILLVAGALSIGISIYEYYGLHEGAGVFFEPTGIFIAILLATGLAFIFEEKAEREFAILNKVNDEEAVEVIRNGINKIVARREVVVGDVVVLTTGCEVPADGRLLRAISLSVDESTLTGEPLAHKTTDPDHFDREATFPSDHVLRGTKVMEGTGAMIVEAVGDATENGKVYTASKIDNSVPTPLDEQLDRLGKMITRVSYSIALLVIVGRMVMYFVNTDFAWISFITYSLQSFMIAVALMVVSIPEGLPMAVTLSLAYSMRRMLKTNNLVRKLHACETMGAVSVICTDKTGTLTQNRMQVSDLQIFGNTPTEVIERGIAANSTAALDLSGSKPSVIGNPTEGALLLWLNSRGIDYDKVRRELKVVNQIPFSTERKYMATLVETPQGNEVLFVKGAPEIVYRMCCEQSNEDDARISSLLREYQAKAMRTLGFAYHLAQPGEQIFSNDGKILCPLTFAGVAAITDPVRSDVPKAVEDTVGAGIDIKIVTGDTPGTAREIGRRIGLWDDSRDSDRNIITGNDFGSLSEEELVERAGNLKIIARARPMDKKRLVEALQKCGEVVAVTGDGTNDAPALKAAHVGLSMGDGTSVAKEASDITIIDNSFASIVRAVMWGRSLYRNIQRFILFQMTVNVVACLIVLAGAFMGLQSPLTVTQMLWVNLIMDTFAAMALASLPPTLSVMAEKPRSRHDFIINRSMWEMIIGVGLLFFIVLFAFLIYLKHTEMDSLTQIGRLAWQTTAHTLSGYERTVFFTTFVFLQFWNMFNARAFATGRSALDLKGCNGFLLIALMILAGQILIVTVGGDFFSVEPMKIADWAIIFFSTSIVLVLGELYRLIRYRA